MDEIKNKLRKYLIESSNNNFWYHGSPEVQKLELEGGFTENFIEEEYINNLEEFYLLNKEMDNAFDSGDMKTYHELLNKVPNFKSKFKFKKPIFLTNDYSVAKTYAIASRAYDYQNAVEGVLKTRVNDGKNVTIKAYGDRFRFIDVAKVKIGFTNFGIPSDEFDKVLNSFNFYVKDTNRIKTDIISAIGAWFNLDSIDVVGVLDSYEGGNIKSIVKMVYNSNSIEIIK